MTIKESSEIHQTGLKKNIPNAMGTLSNRAVKADNCLGDVFLVLNMREYFRTK